MNAIDLSKALELLVSEKFLIPLVLAVVSWFVKDYILAVQKQREENSREEWKSRLTDIWNPLFYWSGVLRFEAAEKGWDRVGAKELSEVLARSAHLLPILHFHTLVRLLESAIGQKTKPPADQEYDKARTYIYGQIELLNYVLFTRHGWFTPSRKTDLFESVKSLMRAAAQIGIHILVWLFVGGLFFVLYVLYDLQYYLALGLAGAIWVSLVAIEMYRRMKLQGQILGRAKD